MSLISQTAFVKVVVLNLILDTVTWQGILSIRSIISALDYMYLSKLPLVWSFAALYKLTLTFFTVVSHRV